MVVVVPLIVKSPDTDRGPVIFVEPVPFGFNIIFPLVSVEVIEFPSILILSTR